MRFAWGVLLIAVSMVNGWVVFADATDHPYITATLAIVCFAVGWLTMVDAFNVYEDEEDEEDWYHK